MSNHRAFQATIKRVVNMPRDRQLSDRLHKLGLNLVNVMWEDTARTPGSAWGANITDMTLQVRDPSRRAHKHLLPVIRYPNFTDKTADVPFDQVKLKVGNEKGEDLQVVTLREYLTNLSNYMSDRRSYHAENRNCSTQ